jgi:hypothetical protein
MKPIAAEWIEKAEGDFATTQRKSVLAKFGTRLLFYINSLCPL